MYSKNSNENYPAANIEGNAYICTVQQVWPSLFYRQPPYMAIPLFNIFSKPPVFGKTFFDNITPIKY